MMSCIARSKYLGAAMLRLALVTGVQGTTSPIYKSSSPGPQTAGVLDNHVAKIITARIIFALIICNDRLFARVAGVGWQHAGDRRSTRSSYTPG